MSPYDRQLVCRTAVGIAIVVAAALSAILRPDVAFLAASMAMLYWLFGR